MCTHTYSHLNKNNRCHEIPQAVRQWRPAGMRQLLRYIMVGVPGFREARLPTSRPLYQTLWSGNTQLLMNWTGMVPLVSKCADWSEEENSRVSTGGVRAVITVVWEWVCVCECCTDLTTLVPSTTTAQHLHSCTGGPTGLNGRGSIQTLWGPRHSKSGGTEQEEGEGAHFPPKEHQSLKKTSFFKNIFYSQLSPSAF